MLGNKCMYEHNPKSETGVTGLFMPFLLWREPKRGFGEGEIGMTYYKDALL